MTCRKRAGLFVTCIVAVLFAGGCPGSSSSSGYPISTIWAQHVVDNSTNVRPVFTAVADIDADGKLDVVAAYAGASTASASVVIFFQDTTDSFTAVTIGSGSTVAGVACLVIADLDGDNVLDIVAGCDSQIVYFHAPSSPRNAAGWTSAPIANSTGNSVGIWTSIAVGDIDQLNGPDIVSCNSNFARWCWFKSPAANITNGTGWTRFDIDNASRAGAASVALADFSGDGRLDVVSTSSDGNVSPRIAWYQNPTDPTQTANWTKFPVGNLAAASRMVIADLDADGLSDVVALNALGRQIGWYKRPADATTAWSGWLLAQFTSATPVDLQAADIDGNGQIDIVVGANNPGLLRWFSPTPGSSQTAQWTENALNNVNLTVGRFALGDIDANGRPDVIVPLQGAITSQDLVAWYTNPQ